jgi:hypothetical protein
MVLRMDSVIGQRQILKIPVIGYSRKDFREINPSR